MLSVTQFPVNISIQRASWLTADNTMLHEEEPSLMQQRDAVFVPQAFRLFVRMTTPRPPGT